MMNIPTPKGKEAMANTQKRMISSQVTDTFSDADHRNKGIFQPWQSLKKQFHGPLYLISR